MEAEFAQLLGLGRGRSVGHHFLRLLVLGKGDHFPDRVFAGSQHDHPVEAVGEPTMGRRAVAEGGQQKPEAPLGILARDAQALEDPLLQLGIVDPDAARAELGAVEHQVIGASPHLQGLAI